MASIEMESEYSMEMAVESMEFHENLRDGPVYEKKNSMAQFLWYDCTFKKQDTVPVTLTFDLWRSISLLIAEK